MSTQTQRAYPFPDHHQNFWQITSIQSSAQSIPVMLFGGFLANTYGPGTSFISICIGNLIIWLIGLAIISMAAENRDNAIQNVRAYLGKGGAIFAALILIVAFIIWYMLEIRAVTSSLKSLLSESHIWKQGMDIRVGAALGLLIALLSLGGIRLIKWICVILFPILLGLLLLAVFTSDQTVIFKNTWGISLFAVVSVVTSNLPGFVILPTFFRHSRSRADSFLALTLITIFDILFQASSIFIGISNISEIGIMYPVMQNYYFMITAIPFVIFSLICLNLVNIYFASAGWEAIVPHAWDSKEFVIIGLIGTAAFTFIQADAPMTYLENIAGNFIACMGVVLMLTFLVRLIVKHRPRPFEKSVSFFCWFIGGITSTIFEFRAFDASYAMLAGISASLLAFLVIVFLEETVWSTKHLIISYRRD